MNALWLGGGIGIVAGLLLLCFCDLHRIADALWYIAEHGVGPISRSPSQTLSLHALEHPERAPALAVDPSRSTPDASAVEEPSNVR